ncbi:hypothetical protein B0H10DRAFT_2219481 [Mycena sp. CBHHK59/15]|nr:hypothetical protein B0H10DRAFT_2219481 [Mycena sp. CBHHK59/15]
MFKPSSSPPADTLTSPTWVYTRGRNSNASDALSLSTHLALVIPLPSSPSAARTPRLLSPCGDASGVLASTPFPARIWGALPRRHLLARTLSSTSSYDLRLVAILQCCGSQCENKLLGGLELLDAKLTVKGISVLNTLFWLLWLGIGSIPSGASRPGIISQTSTVST